jgi:hypothetical protein
MSIDWLKLAARLQDEQSKMVHHEGAQPYGNEFYAEALRRAFGYQRQDGTDGRDLPYDTVSPSTGLTTVAEADHLRESHTIVDRLNSERANEEVKRMHAEVRRVYREARRDLAKELRTWCNERSVPSRFRREGVLLAADRLNPAAAVWPGTMGDGQRMRDTETADVNRGVL